MAATSVKTSRDMIAQSLDETNSAVRVNVVAGAGSGGTASTDDAAFTAGGGSGTPIMGFATSDTVDSGDVGVVGMDTSRNLKVSIEADNAGIGGGTQYADGAARGTATGTIAMGDDGTNIQSLACGTDGVLKADINSALPAGTNAIGKLAANSGVDIGDVDVLSLPNVTLAAGTNTNEIVGDAAHDAAIAGNPVRIGSRAQTSDFTAVASGDTVDSLATTLGKQVTYPFALPGQSWSYAAASGGITNTTGVTIKTAAGAGVRNYLTDLQIINGHASTSTDVQIRDGASGAVLWRGFAQAAGGGISVHFNTPIRGTANTLLEVACGTTGAAVYVNAQGFTSAE